MEDKELAHLGIEELKKRKKFASLILGVLFSVLLANAILAILKGNIALVGVSAAVVVCGLPLMIRIKKIKQELGQRMKS